MNKILEAYQNKPKTIDEFKRGNIKYITTRLLALIKKLDKADVSLFYKYYGKASAKDDGILKATKFEVDTGSFHTGPDGYITFEAYLEYENDEGDTDAVFNLIVDENVAGVELEKQ